MVTVRIFPHSEKTAQGTYSDPAAKVSSKLPIRLTIQQAQAINDEVAKAGKTRPDPGVYEQIHKRLLAVPIPVPVDKRGAGIENVRRGFEKHEVVPLPGFKPATDLPEGWGIYSMYDSGSNHKVDNAATIAWRHIWNFWTSYVEGGSMGGKTVKDSLGDARWTWEGWEDR